MNLRPYLATALLSLALLACSRNDDDGSPNNPNPVDPGATATDTLGAGWTRTNTGLFGNLTDVYFTDSLRGYVAADMGLFYSGNGGRTWSTVPMPAGTSPGFVNIGAWDGVAVLANTLSELVRSVNGGAATRRSYSTVTGAEGFRDVFSVSATRSYAVSDRHFWRSTDGGVSFDTLYRFPNEVPSNMTLFFLDNDRGWVARFDGLYQTTDGGASWTRVSDIGGQPGGVHFFPDGVTGYFSAGSFFFKTTDGGSTRTPMPLPGIVASQGDITDLHFLDAQNGYATAHGRIFRTADGGGTWTRVVRMQQLLIELHFTDPQHGWAAGLNGTFLRFQQP